LGSVVLEMQVEEADEYVGDNLQVGVVEEGVVETTA